MQPQRQFARSPTLRDKGRDMAISTTRVNCLHSNEKTTQAVNILRRSLWRHKQREESGNASHLLHIFVRVESSLLQLGVATGRVFRDTGRAGRAELVETLAIDDATGTNGRWERAHCDGHRCTAASRRLWVGLEKSLEGGEGLGRQFRLEAVR